LRLQDCYTLILKPYRWMLQPGLGASDYTRFVEESRMVLPSAQNYATIGASGRAKTLADDDRETGFPGEDYAHPADCHEPSQTTQ
jgi:hypothetical protein